MGWEAGPNVIMHGGAWQGMKRFAESEKGCRRDHGGEISQKEKKQAPVTIRHYT